MVTPSSVQSMHGFRRACTLFGGNLRRLAATVQVQRQQQSPGPHTDQEPHSVIEAHSHRLAARSTLRSEMF